MEKQESPTLEKCIHEWVIQMVGRKMRLKQERESLFKKGSISQRTKASAHEIGGRIASIDEALVNMDQMMRAHMIDPARFFKLELLDDRGNPQKVDASISTILNA